jgi:VanZ family protein
MRLPRPFTLAVTIGMSAGYLILGVLPQSPPGIRTLPDTVVHSGAYAVLAASACETAAALGIGAPALAGWSYAVVHGGVLEVLQSFFPPRTPEWKDLGMDALGGFLGAATWWLVRRRR